ncbi:MAG TPA: hypothetical protein VLX92_21270 [Kofleriaceae bacterium]|nr:hypothetical protein [Kofleriaceae bacterium]
MRAPSLLVLVGCVPVYGGGGFPTLHGVPATVGCVDVVLARGSDAAAKGPVVDYVFGNRCNHTVVVDFTALRVRGHDASGNELALVPYDPQHELRPLPLPARGVGHEMIEYDATGGAALVQPDQAAVAQQLADLRAQVIASAPGPQASADEIRAWRDQVSELASRTGEIASRLEPHTEIDPRSLCIDVARFEAGLRGERWLCLRDADDYSVTSAGDGVRVR